MKHNLLVIVLALVGLLCPAWEGAAAETLGCTFTGMANNQATTWEVVFAGFTGDDGVIASLMYGVNLSTNAGLNGSAYLNGGFPAQLTWGEGPSASFPFRRFVYVTLGSNLQGTGMVIDIGASGTFQSTITITGGNCQI